MDKVRQWSWKTAKLAVVWKKKKGWVGVGVWVSVGGYSVRKRSVKKTPKNTHTPQHKADLKRESRAGGGGGGSGGGFSIQKMSVKKTLHNTKLIWSRDLSTVCLFFRLHCLAWTLQRLRLPCVLWADLKQGSEHSLFVFQVTLLGMDVTAPTTTLRSLSWFEAGIWAQFVCFSGYIAWHGRYSAYDYPAFSELIWSRDLSTVCLFFRLHCLAWTLQRLRLPCVLCLHAAHKQRSDASSMSCL